jgi:hypothetical protein
MVQYDDEEGECATKKKETIGGRTVALTRNRSRMRGRRSEHQTFKKMVKSSELLWKWNVLECTPSTSSMCKSHAAALD